MPRKINLKNTQIMGIINLTPDSFYDGGNIVNITDFLLRAEQHLQEGATIIDLGAEASGPNSLEVNLETELTRLVPYVTALNKLKEKYKFKISIDTYKSQVALECLKLGADIINDITALRADLKMIEVLKKYDSTATLMYSKDNSARTSKKAIKYTDIIKTIIDFFEERLKYCKKNNFDKNKIILDPGMGAFISTIPDYSYQIIEKLAELKNHFNLPILIGTSYKSMHQFPIEQRLIPSITTAFLSAINGADIIRVHHVKEHKQALDTFSF